MATNPSADARDPFDDENIWVRPIPPDPRVFKQIPANELKLDKNVQRECDPERSRRILNEFDWSKFEAPTVTPNGDGTYNIEEGQHRVWAVKLNDAAVGDQTLVWCAVAPEKTKTERAQLGLDIARGRKTHSALEQWNQRLHANHPHEVRATAALKARGLRLGKTTSASTIGAAATVRTIVHGGGYSPEYGADLLGNVTDVIAEAFPQHDPESSVTRWDRDLLLAVAEILHRNPEIDTVRLVKRLRVRPAPQWISLGRPNELPAHQVIGSKLIDLYNSGLRRGRLSW